MINDKIFFNYPYLYFSARTSTWQGNLAVVFIWAYDVNAKESVIVAVGHGEDHKAASNKALKRIGEDFGYHVETELRLSLE